MGRGLTIALLGSLALNILAIGFIGGRMIGGPLTTGHHDVSPRAGGGFWSRGEGLPPESREKFHAVFDRRRDELHERSREVHRLHREFSTAVAAPEWNRETVERAQRAFKSAEARRDELMSRLLLDALEALPAEDRLMLMQRGEHFHHRRHDRLRRRFDDRREPAPPEGE